MNRIFTAAIILLTLPTILFAQRQITVVGDGLAKAKPDFAIISLTIHSKNASSAAAYTSSNEDLTHLTTMLGNAGVSATDIEQRDFRTYHNDYDYSYASRTSKMTPAPPPPPVTAPISMKKKSSKKHDKKEDVAEVDSMMTPVVSDPEPAPEPPPVRNPYEITTTYQVKVRNLQSLASVMDACEQAGSTNPEIAYYDVTDKEKLRITAEADAMKNAREKAARLVKEMGGTLGEITSIADPLGESGLSSIVKLVYDEIRKERKSGMQEVTEMASVKVTFSVK